MADGGGTLTLATGTTQDGPTPPGVRRGPGHGAGVPAANRARIFEPFFTTKAQGTGLGLATARKFVEAHGGSIALVDRSSAGAVFHVTFPVGPGV